MPSLFVVSPERRAPLADNRHNIFRRVFLQGGLGTSPGSGRGERELTRSGTIILKPSLQNHLKKFKNKKKIEKTSKKNIDMSTQ